MRKFRRNGLALLGSFLSLAAGSDVWAQSATVTLGSQKQYIRGYGGINHAAWAGDMTAAERALAFGNGTGQLGFSILRVPVTDGNPDSVNVATAKAAIAAGAIVFASPWNAAGTYASSQFAAYATHLSNFVTYMKNQGVALYAISVQNEPDYGSEGGWGQWSAASCHDFVLSYGASIPTRLISCESFNYKKSYYDPILNDAAALANLDIFGTHLYGTATSDYAYPLFDAKGAGKERWMTEHYTDSTTDANSWPNALGVASELHNAMVAAQFNAYVWWYIKRSYGPINNGAVTKRGYCMAHWSKFVRPGFYRVDATASPASGLSLSAFKGDSGVVVVVVNTNTSSKSLSISLSGSAPSSFTKYTTSASKSLSNEGTVAASNGSLSVSLDASSVTSLVASGATSTGGSAGTGGTSSTAGASSTGGVPASAGAPGAGGSSGGKASGGSSGSGGAKTSGGSVGSGGSSGSGAGPASGGSPSTGGASSTGGSTLSGGGSAMGGSSPSGGSAIAAGGSATTGGTTPTGGVSGAGATSASGGTTANSGGVGSSAGANAGATNNDPRPADSAGCGCRVAGVSTGSSSSNALGLLGALAPLALLARRRRVRS
jgi:glucuronoarabinoxylan endo-1,4-beta-xylanase